MRNRKNKDLRNVFLFLSLIAGISLVFIMLVGYDRRNKSGVLGYNSNGNSWGGSWGNQQTTPTGTTTMSLTPTETKDVTPSVTITITATPTIEVTQMPTPTEVVVTTQATPEPTQELKKQEPEVKKEVQIEYVYKTEKQFVLVPVTERSVVSQTPYVAPVVTKSVLKIIQNKIGEVGRGEILSKPKPSATPVVTLKIDNPQQNDTLTADADIIYRLMGNKVLLAAETKEGQQLKIKEGDLRSAEITMNKILDKKELALRVTGENNFALVQGDVVTTLDMPVSVNIDSHKVFLETGEGKKELKILPEEAVRQAVELKSFERLNKDSVPSVEDLGEELAYKVVGDKTYKLFGFFNVKTKQNVYITAETGEVIEGNQPLLTRAVRLFSI